MLLSEWSRFQTKPKLFSLVGSCGRYMDLEALGEDIVRSPLVRIWWNLLNSCENLLPIVNCWSLMVTMWIWLFAGGVLVVIWWVVLVAIFGDSCWCLSGGNLVACSILVVTWWQLLVGLWWQTGGEQVEARPGGPPMVVASSTTLKPILASPSPYLYTSIWDGVFSTVRCSIPHPHLDTIHSIPST